MDRLQFLCQQKIQELQVIICMAKKQLRNAPKGTLHTSPKRGTFQYFYKGEEPNSQRKYIKQADIKQAQALAQKEYAMKILALAEKAQHTLKRLSTTYTTQDFIQVYNSLPNGKRTLIIPFIESDEEFIARWYKEKTKYKESRQAEDSYTLSEEDGIYTEKGELVRSKSEKMLMDKLYMMDIPYLYEVPLYLEGFGTIKPDLLVLNIRTREEFYWEHLGLMDDNQYCEKAIKKIECYQKNNIFVGEQLLLTFETGKHPINMKSVEQLINKYLL